MLRLDSWLAIILCTSVVCVSLASATSADTFGTGANRFTIDFVTIPVDPNPTSGYGIVNRDYRMSIYETTHGQWDKFAASLGVPVTGNPTSAYGEGPWWPGANIPLDSVSWYEAAQFANWLNTSSGHQAAYKFTGTQGTSNYSLGIWSPAEAAGGTNLYRHKDAKYFIPSEDEWVKAAYWNGTIIQLRSMKSGESLHQGDGTNGTGWNYFNKWYSTDPRGPWNVGSGSEELNGTFDMMGNVGEWMESPYSDDDFAANARRVVRGGSYYYGEYGDLRSVARGRPYPNEQYGPRGFRVASEVPEPFSLGLISLGSLALLKTRRRAA